VRCVLALLVLAIVFACGGSDEAPAPAPKSDRAGPTDVEMVAAMEAHYTSAIVAHDALIQGDVAAFRMHLGELDSHALPSNSPDVWKPFDGQLHAAARKARETGDLAAAANVMGMVTLACGSCHQSVGGGPVYPVPPLDSESQQLAAQMREHQWATQLLWDGVTGPSGYAWERGAVELAATRIFADGDVPDAPDDSLLAREAELRGLGKEAIATVSLADRASLYGRMLATCGGCHQAAGVKLPPYKSAPPSGG
jgi:cytochrome c553